jgi:ribonucleoside-triphosphate reductase
VFHAYLGEKLPDWQAAANLVRTIAENYRLPYYTLSPTYSICREHGYIKGEAATCPICNAPTEVYSRITGYYRPVQNWNDGKLQEYANRREYDVTHSQCKRTGLPQQRVEELTLPESGKTVKYLFTTKTCPNCRAAKEYLKEDQVELVDAEENKELAEQYHIMQAPTLVVVDREGVHKYCNASNIKKYADMLYADA